MKPILDLYRRAFADQPSTAGWLSLVIFINRMGGVVITFIALYLTQELDQPITAAGVVLSAYGVGTLGVLIWIVAELLHRRLRTPSPTQSEATRAEPALVEEVVTGG